MDPVALSDLKNAIERFSYSNHSSNGTTSDYATIENLNCAVNDLAKLVVKLIDAIEK